MKTSKLIEYKLLDVEGFESDHKVTRLRVSLTKESFVRKMYQYKLTDKGAVSDFVEKMVKKEFGREPRKIKLKTVESAVRMMQKIIAILQSAIDDHVPVKMVTAKKPVARSAALAASQSNTTAATAAASSSASRSNVASTSASSSSAARSNATSAAAASAEAATPSSASRSNVASTSASSSFATQSTTAAAAASDAEAAADAAAVESALLLLTPSFLSSSLALSDIGHSDGVANPDLTAVTSSYPDANPIAPTAPNAGTAGQRGRRATFSVGSRSHSSAPSAGSQRRNRSSSTRRTPGKSGSTARTQSKKPVASSFGNLPIVKAVKASARSMVPKNPRLGGLLVGGNLVQDNAGRAEAHLDQWFDGMWDRVDGTRVGAGVPLVGLS